MHCVFLIESTVNGNFAAENQRSKSEGKIHCCLLDTFPVFWCTLMEQHKIKFLYPWNTIYPFCGKCIRKMTYQDRIQRENFSVIKKCFTGLLVRGPTKKAATLHSNRLTC